MGKFLIMNQKELRRKTLLDAVACEKLTLIECSQKLDVSYRQIKRIWSLYRQKGDKGLCHRNRGKTPPNAYSNAHREKILALYQEKYVGFGPTLAAEKMEEDDSLVVQKETLRLWLKQAGLWMRKRKHVVYRERRERRSQFGDLLQIDGSIHDWFSEQEHTCLLNMVDDATGKTFALLDTGETTKILLTCLKKWIERYGIPKAVYVDLKGVYIGQRRLAAVLEEEEPQGKSVFQTVCRALDIEIIKAYSPQAKGRVERKHQVFQDRFLKDLKLYGIHTIEAANAHLEKTFLDQINRKFAQSPKDPIDAHRDPKGYGNLDEILCWQYERQIRNDWSVRYHNQYFQLQEPTKKIEVQPGQFVTMKIYLDGNIKFWYAGKTLAHRELKSKPVPPYLLKRKYLLQKPFRETAPST